MDFIRELDFFIVPKITEITPAMPICIEEADLPKHISLADNNFNIPGEIDLLLGAECFFDLLKENKIRSTSHNLLFQETHFGYVASGVVNSSTELQYCGLMTQTKQLEETLQKFWEIEGFGESAIPLNSEEKFCEDHFLKTYYREVDGRYVVSMPMEDPALLRKSRNLAEKRLDGIWKRLDRDSNLKSLYSAFMEEYKILNHMELVEDAENDSDCYVIPHHSVYKPEKSSTKLRVVFNASMPTTSGLSLNDILLKGKIPQQDLFSIMVRFRKHRYAFTADVQKMYRMIEINPSQRRFLQILWKNSFDSPVETYQLKTVTYGTSNAPYLATRALKQLVLDENNHLPLASSVVLNDMYVDDVLSGESTLEGTKLLQSQLVELMKRGKMNLHKWGANHPDLLAFENKGISEYSFSDQPECESVKTLGVLWNTVIDCFFYKIELHEKDSYTKRDVLSLISRIFDPLGLIGPVITKAKIFLQKLWLLKIDWDQPVPACIERNWIDFVSTLPELINLAIPRYVFREDSIVIQGFADSSQMAYGAAIYVQSIPTDGLPSARLLCSKSRVAPLKTLSIPRLELCACLLLAQLMHKVLPSLKIPIEKVILSTDSMICLAWIGKSPHVLKTFVSNRVAAIQELTDSYEWRHISSEENPADKISRGLDAKDIVNCKLWWNGPSFLREEGPPDENNLVELDSNTDYNCEFKTTIDSNFATLHSNSFVNNLLTLTNSYLKLIHVLSFIFRFIRNARKNQIRVVGPITLEEVRRAELFLISEVQGGEFFSEIASIKKGAQISPRSKLKTLNVFLDNDGLLRVGSRIAHAQVSYNSKYPIILPARHKLTRLIMLHHHLKYFHLGSQALLNSVRQKFWPVSGRNLARKIVHDCVICCKQNPVPVTQVMGNLPIERVVPNFTFNKSGLDFCGPFFIRSKKSRKGLYQKVYVAVFVCLQLVQYI